MRWWTMDVLIRIDSNPYINRLLKTKEGFFFSSNLPDQDRYRHIRMIITSNDG